VLYLYFANISINPLIIFITGLAVGIAGGAFGSLANIVIAPSLNMLGIPLPISVSSSAGTNFAKTSNLIFKGPEPAALKRVGVVTGLIGLPGVILGFKLHLLLVETHLGAAFIKFSYIAILLAVAAMIFRQWIFFNRNDYYDDVPFPLVGINWLFPLAIPGGSGLNHITTGRVAAIGLSLGLTTGLLGIGPGVLGLPLFMYILGLPHQNAAATDAVAMAIIGTGALFTYAAAGRVEFLVILILILSVSLGNQIAMILPGELNLSHARLAFSVALAVIALSVAISHFNTAFSHILMSATGLILSLFIILYACVTSHPAYLKKVL